MEDIFEIVYKALGNDMISKFIEIFIKNISSVFIFFLTHSLSNYSYLYIYLEQVVGIWDDLQKNYVQDCRQTLV